MILGITFAAYAVGALLGMGAHRGGPALRQGWPAYLRIQLVATAALVGLFSAWRLTGIHEIVAPIALAGVGGLLLVVAGLLPGDRSAGLAELEGWAAFPNGTFWVLPMAGALLGATASTITALANAVYAGPNAICIHLMRRDAPIPQRRSTTWTDQSMLLAVVAGLALHLVGPAPEASRWVLDIAGPLLAFVGAGLYTGSVLHPHNASVERTGDALSRFALLSGVRIVYLVVLALITHSTAVAVIAVLSAFGPPAFNPPQQAVLYGYRSAVVMVAVRWSWILVPIGLGVAVLLR
jgi:hypothetical protein